MAMMQAELQKKLLNIARRAPMSHPLIVLPDENAQIQPNQLFDSSDSKHVLELGAGFGELCFHYAKENPDHRFIAFEIKWDRIRSLLKRIDRAGLTNVRIVPVNFSWFLESMLPHNSFDTLIAYFPDPWPKRRHWKHRLVQQNFPDRILPLLRKNARICLATDFGPYARKMLRIMNRHEFESNYPRPFFVQKNPFGVETRFEKLMNESHQYYMEWKLK